MADIPRTPLLARPDTGLLKVAAEDLMTYLRSGQKLSGNGVQNRENVVLEKAMEAIYGPGIWEEVRQYTSTIKC